MSFTLLIRLFALGMLAVLLGMLIIFASRLEGCRRTITVGCTGIVIASGSFVIDRIMGNVPFSWNTPLLIVSCFVSCIGILDAVRLNSSRRRR